MALPEPARPGPAPGSARAADAPPAAGPPSGVDDSEPDEFPLEDLGMDPPPEAGLDPDLLPGFPVGTGPLASPVAAAQEPLLPLQEAIARIPEDLRRQMKDLLLADFREVQRWQVKD